MPASRLTLICGAAVGGGYDALARLLARHLNKHIPGNPTIVVQNQPAAGSARHHQPDLQYRAASDGTVIALDSARHADLKLINPAQIRFEVDKLNWLGSMANEVGVALAWHTAPHKTAKDLFDKELIVGGHAGVDPELTPRLYNAVLGTKFKIIIGYNGTADIALAIERGEVARHRRLVVVEPQEAEADWIRDKQITILLQSGLKNMPELPNVPNALEFAKNASPTARCSSCFSPRRRRRGRSLRRPACRRTGLRYCARPSRRWRKDRGIPGRCGEIQPRRRSDVGRGAWTRSSI